MTFQNRFERRKPEETPQIGDWVRFTFEPRIRGRKTGQIIIKERELKEIHETNVGKCGAFIDDATGDIVEIELDRLQKALYPQESEIKNPLNRKSLLN